MENYKLSVTIVIALLFCAFPINAGNAIIQNSQLLDTEYSQPSSYSDIIFHLSCDAKGDADKSGGSATITYDAGIVLNETDEHVGTGCLDQTNTGSADFDFAISGNVDFASGRLGFWWNPQEALTNAGRIVTTIGDDFYAFADTSNQKLSLRYLGTTDTNNGSFTPGTWTFLEFQFNGNVCNVYQDGVWIAGPTGTGSVDDTQISFGAQDSNSLDQLWDNIISTNDDSRNLYAISTETDYS